VDRDATAIQLPQDGIGLGSEVGGEVRIPLPDSENGETYVVGGLHSSLIRRIFNPVKDGITFP